MDWGWERSQPPPEENNHHEKTRARGHELSRNVVGNDLLTVYKHLGSRLYHVINLILESPSCQFS